MKVDSSAGLPKRICVEKIVSSRYSNKERPLSWDERTPGVDIVETSDGEVIKLKSDGGQSPPKQGWIVLLTAGTSESGYNWTLYGLAR